MDVYWPDLDVGQPFRKQEGPFKCDPMRVKSYPASWLVDTLMTLGAFCLWLAPVVIVLAFWLLS